MKNDGRCQDCHELLVYRFTIGNVQEWECTGCHQLYHHEVFSDTMNKKLEEVKA
jgi:hypothetical protein